MAGGICIDVVPVESRVIIGTDRVIALVTWLTATMTVVVVLILLVVI